MAQVFGTSVEAMPPDFFEMESTEFAGGGRRKSSYLQKTTAALLWRMRMGRIRGKRTIANVIGL